MNNNDENMNKEKIALRDTFLDFMSHIVYELPKPSESILNYKTNPVMSINIDYPKFSFGFQHFVHANKDKLDILSQFEGKKKVYNVINYYHLDIDNHNIDINQMAKVYFDSNPKPDPLSDNFFKLWEILMTFQLISNDGNITTSHYGVGDGSFVQSLLFFRDMFTKNTKGDKYNIVKTDSIEKRQPRLNDSFMKYYGKEKSKRINIVTKGTKSDLITISCFGKWEYRNLIEQDSLGSLLNQLKEALTNQKPKGNLICHIYESFNVTTNKIMYMLTELYDKVYVFKPFTGQTSSSDKFIICMNFKGKPDKAIKALSEMISATKNTNKYLVNVFSDFTLHKIHFLFTKSDHVFGANYFF